MRAAGYTALLWIGVALSPASGSAASVPQIQGLVAQAEKEARSNPDALHRDAFAALAALKTSPNPDLEIRTRLLLCEYDSERDLAAAEEQARQTLLLLPQAHDPGLQAGVLTCQGETRETAGDNAQALQLFSTAISIASAAHNDEKLANALSSRGYLLGIQGAYAAGLADLRQAQDLFDRMGRHYDAVSCRESIATLYSRMGDNAEAAHLYAEVLRMQQQDGMVREQAVTLHNLARAYERSHQWDLAHTAYNQALDLARGLKYSRAEAYALRGLAAVKIAANDPTGALADLERASVLQSGTPDARLAAKINLDKGRALHLEGRLTESLAALQQARGVFKSADTAAELVSTDDELAVVQAALGEWRAAYLTKAEAAQQQEALLQHQLDQRFAALKVEYDTAAQQQENRVLLRENAATAGALDQSRRVRQLQGVVIALGLALAAVLMWLVILNRGRAQRMGSLAMTDELTQAPNRRAVLSVLSELLKRPEASPCAILIMDIDFFKRINDQHGHAAGDEVLKLVAEAVRSMAKAPTSFGRLGGEEFLLVLPDSGLAEARRWAEALRLKIASIDTRAAIPGHAGVTTSVGLTVSIAGTDDPGSMLARADLALYAAKRSGRNCVRVEPAPDDELQSDAPGPGMLEETAVLESPAKRGPGH